MPCPMEMAAMAEQQSDATMQGTSTAKMGDCCNDMETLLKTGKPCKVGQDCKIGSLALSVHFPSIPIWRPPA